MVSIINSYVMVMNFQHPPTVIICVWLGCDDDGDDDHDDWVEENKVCELARRSYISHHF